MPAKNSWRARSQLALPAAKIMQEDKQKVERRKRYTVPVLVLKDHGGIIPVYLVYLVYYPVLRRRTSTGTTYSIYLVPGTVYQYRTVPVRYIRFVVLCVP